MSLSKLQETVKDGEAWRAAVQQNQIGLSNWTAAFICTPHPTLLGHHNSAPSAAAGSLQPAGLHVVVYVYICVSASIPQSTLSPPPHPLVHMSMLYPCISESPENRFICSIFYIPHIWVNICDLFFSFWLTEMDKLKNPQRIWQLPRPQTTHFQRG